MSASGFITVLFVVAIGCVACNREDSPSGEERATELSADQPLSPTPLPTESTEPETAKQMEQDVAMAREQAEEARSQVDMAGKVTEATGRHKIETEKCHALAGSERTECIAKADRALERVKAELEREQPH